jgi:lysozyme
MKTSQKGLDLIKQFEGLKLTAYWCPAGVPTIGYGTTKGVTHEDVRRKHTISKAEAEAKLLEDLVEYEVAVLKACAIPPNQHQFDAFVCFAFNIGVAGFRGSTVCKAHNRGDEQAASRAFGLWNKATVNGKKVVLAGLTRRRAAEAALYLEPMPQEVQEPMPQEVEPERPMTASTINRAGVVAGGTATVATVAEVLQSVNEVKDGVSQLENWLVPALLVAVVVLAGYIVIERVKQRSGGWA